MSKLAVSSELCLSISKQSINSLFVLHENYFTGVRLRRSLDLVRMVRWCVNGFPSCSVLSSVVFSSVFQSSVGTGLFPVLCASVYGAAQTFVGSKCTESGLVWFVYSD